MHRGGTLILCSTALALSACVADNGELNVRAIADPFAKATKNGNPMVVEGRSLLALGSVGLALEAFRKAQREQPANIEAIAGIAECYERMGRYDVARSKYEEALAIAPNNPILLNTFAASLERQGLRGQAAALRAEASKAEAESAAALASSATQASVSVATAPTVAPKAVPIAVPNFSKIAQAAPPQSAPKVAQVVPPPVAPKVAPVVPPPAAPRIAQVVPPTTQVAKAPAPKAEPVSITTWTFEPSQVSMSAATAAASAQALAANTVTVNVPDPEPDVAPVPATVAPPARTAPAPRPAQALAKTNPRTIVSTASAQPRLERLSLGEVALVTHGGPIWRPQLVAQSRQSVTVRFVPLRPATAIANVRILNAARRQGIAARTRQVLLDRGWRKIEIGDAPQMRESSLVLYPANRRILGRSLAAQFGYRSAVSNDIKELVVLVGRDSGIGSSRRSRA